MNSRRHFISLFIAQLVQQPFRVLMSFFGTAPAYAEFDEVAELDSKLPSPAEVGRWYLFVGDTFVEPTQGSRYTNIDFSKQHTFYTVVDGSIATPGEQCAFIFNSIRVSDQKTGGAAQTVKIENNAIDPDDTGLPKSLSHSMSLYDYTQFQNGLEPSRDGQRTVLSFLNLELETSSGTIYTKDFYSSFQMASVSDPPDHLAYYTYLMRFRAKGERRLRRYRTGPFEVFYTRNYTHICSINIESDPLTIVMEAGGA